VGGTIGIVLASIVTTVVDKMLMPASISIPILVIAVLVSITVGVLAGVLPAYRAARLDPVESLRYE
jgi:putative ABC transport system permease protein